ncbi:MAG: class I SAM-dependent methyltransferase [Opitutales bacterium]
MQPSLFLDSVAFYGRTLREYRAFFQLSDADLNSRRILDVSAGCASFCAEATRLGAEVTAVDPLYDRSPTALAALARHDIAQVLARARSGEEGFVFSFFKDFDEVERLRRAALESFLSDYLHGRAQQRYVPGALPELPFADDSFDCALCGHFLLLYAYQFSEAFHRAALGELLRVAREVRLYPLIQPDGTAPVFLDSLLLELRSQGHRATIVPLEYEFFRGANQMLQLTRDG